MNQLLWCAVIATLLSGSIRSMAGETSSDQSFKTIEWTDLVPPEILEILLNPPEYIADIEDGSLDDQLSSQIQNSLAAASDDEYQMALTSTEVNLDFDRAMVRIPGFVVPLEFDDDQAITQFFLVPYFGACVHMPPPPPNQIILVNSPDGIQLDDLYAPVWLSGELLADLTENDMASAAYSLKLSAIEIYTE